MGIFPVEFPTTTADRFESFPVLHYLAFIKEEDALIERSFCDLAEKLMIVLVLN